MTIGDLVNEVRDVNPILADDLARCDFDARDVTPVERVQTRSGEETMRIAGRYLHSSIDPVREADRFAKDVQRHNPDLLFVVGLGLGYHLEALRRDNRQLPIVVVIGDPGELVDCIRFRNATWWRRWGPDRLLLTADSGIVRDAIAAYGSYTPHLAALTGARSLFSEQWEAIASSLERWRQREEVNRNTLRRFGRRWVQNTIHNVARWGLIPGIDGLEGIAAEIPAVVFGAGPTLDAIAPQIAPCLAGTLVVAVDTALPALSRYGIEADLAIVADPQYWNSRHIDHPPGKLPTLVAESATNPRVLRLWSGRRLVSASLFPLGAFIDRRIGRSRRLGAGGSVATSAWDLARLLGSREIFLVGVDLAFPQRRIHCLGSFFEKRITASGRRLRPAEHEMARYLHGGVPVKVENVAGDLVLSDKRMAVYRSWFVEQCAMHPEVATRVLSPEGSKIEGIELVDVGDFTKRIGIRDTIKTRITEQIKNYAATRDETAPATGLIEEITASVARIASLAQDGIDLCRSILASGNRHPAVLQNFDRLDHQLLSMSEGELAGFIAAEQVTQAALSEVQSVEDSIEQARQIYQAVLDSCIFHQSAVARTRRQSQV